MLWAPWYTQTCLYTKMCEGIMGQDSRAERWLTLLRDGTPEQQALARTELGLILERRGQIDEAVRAYWTNVQAGVSDPRPYYRLAAIHRRLGDEAAAARGLVLLPGQSLPVQPTRPRLTRHAQARPRPRPLHNPFMLLIGVGCGGLATFLLLVVLTAVLLGAGGTTECPDVMTRFPEWRDPEGAVFTALSPVGRESRLSVLRLATGSESHYDAFRIPADETVASWIMTSLYEEYTRRPVRTLLHTAGTLEQHVALQVSWRSIRVTRGHRGYDLPPLRPIVSPREWSEMHSWPSSSCAGAILASPENAYLARLMSATVGDTGLWN
jgi:hypothetical protein